MTLYEGMAGISPNAFINTLGRSYSITAEVEVPAGGAHGVILSNGGRFGGYALYMKGGRVTEVYNFGGLKSTPVSSGVLAPGTHSVRYEFAYDGGAPGSGGVSTLIVDGKKVGEARIDRTLPFFLSDEGASVGLDEETPVTDDYAQGDNHFTGRILRVTVETKGAENVADATRDARTRAQIAEE
jgi:arylsulfatase